jgi:hypothetical protein
MLNLLNDAEALLLGQPQGCTGQAQDPAQRNGGCGARSQRLDHRLRDPDGVRMLVDLLIANVSA